MARDTARQLATVGGHCDDRTSDRAISANTHKHIETVPPAALAPTTPTTTNWINTIRVEKTNEESDCNQMQANTGKYRSDGDKKEGKDDTESPLTLSIRLPKRVWGGKVCADGWCFLESAVHKRLKRTNTYTAVKEVMLTVWLTREWNCTLSVVW